jgi:hypothetical protein
MENQDVTEIPGASGCNSDLQSAEAHLLRAEADLAIAQAAGRRAEHEMEEAVQEVREAELSHHEIHFSVDGEDYETRKPEWTPNLIISEFGKKDPATNYLVAIHGTQKTSFQGKGDEKIRLSECQAFQIISTGPTPVSDVTGPAAFSIGLRGLGYEPTCLPNHPDHVVFDYCVDVGPFAGHMVRLGFIVPPDFPNITPSGPHVSPHIRAIHPTNDIPHPRGGVHQSQSGCFQQGAGGEWQYWSRPCADWAKCKKTVTAYMGFIWRLWETQ